MIRLAHVITNLETGGAQMMLLKLLTHTPREAIEPYVYSLAPAGGEIADRVRALNVPVREARFQSSGTVALSFLRLIKWLRRDSPDVVQTWMYHGDLAGGCAAKLARLGAPIVWSIRNNRLDPSARRRTVWVVKTCARLSGSLPDAIVSCSSTAAETHVAVGYDAAKIVIVPNGFDLASFTPSQEARASLRRELRLPADSFLIGLVARFDPQKDHATFMRAAARLHREVPQVHFVLCGREVTEENAQLRELIRTSGIARVCHLLGERKDMPRITAALDIASSTSVSEAFSNSIGEAMACGVPCVVTDVGESALIVGDTGVVVPPREPDAICDGWKHLLGCAVPERLARGERARRRIADHFSIGAVATAYQDLYQELSKSSRACAAQASNRREPKLRSRPVQ